MAPRPAWRWDSKKGGFVPVSGDWWEWVPSDGVLRPRDHDGWRWDQKRGAWVDVSAAKPDAPKVTEPSPEKPN